MPAINAPGKFSGFRFYGIDLTNPNLATAPLAIPLQIAVTVFGVTGAGDALVFGVPTANCGGLISPRKR